MVLELVTLIVGAATAVASPFLPSLAKRIACLAAKWSIRDEKIHQKLQNLERTVSDIQKKVAAGENNFYPSNNYQLVVEEVNNVLFDVEDLLAHVEAGSKPWKGGKLGVKIDELQNRLDDLATQVHSHESHSGFSRHPQMGNKQTTSKVDESGVFGRINDLREIRRLMFRWKTKEEEGVRVISIVGMVGVGKTTLAQLVFSDQNVQEEFKPDRMWWVSVSFDDDVSKISRSIHESATKTIANSNIAHLSSLESVHHKLEEIVGKTEKFLLVLDGICDVDFENWRQLILPFRSAATGSIILVTTRSLLVSSIVSDRNEYRLGVLFDENDCWKIIKYHMMETEFEGDEDFEKSGLELAKKCKGIPLVAISIGYAFRIKRQLQHQWREIFECKHWELGGEYKNQIYPVLKFGYHKLPAHLKRCFTYSSLFPQGRLPQRDDLIQLWAAEGFIQDTETTSEEEDINQAKTIGRDYFDKLCLESFFQVSSNKPGPVQKESNKSAEYEMHGYVHDFARLVSTNLCCAYEGNKSNVSQIATNVRHSSLACEKIESSTWKGFYKYQKLRTFMLLSDHTMIQDKYIPNDFFKLICIRVLNLSGSDISHLSDQISKLKLLRHLNLSSTSIEKLPKTIGEVCGLERLNIRNCRSLVYLPSSINKLTKLRQIEDDRKLTAQLVHVGELISLETLPEFVVETEQGRKIEELKDMSWLHGSICIKQLENVANREEAKVAQLNKKQYLEKLELHWEPKKTRKVDQEVLEGLEPHHMLKELRIKGYRGLQFPEWMSQTSFDKLVRVHLEECASCTLLPSLGELPLLKFVVIEKMDNLECVNDQFSAGFSSLKTLKFKNMLRLKSWTRIQENAMPQLRELTIEACPEFVTLPSLYILSSLKLLEINGCRELKSFPGEGLPGSLQCLIILGSDLLKTRYCTMGKNDWDKVSRIPEIETDDGKIIEEGCYAKVQENVALSRDFGNIRLNQLDRSKRVKIMT